MVEVPGLLQTIAEISVAIAGFSGLVVALRKGTGPLTNVQKYRLQVLLLLAFGAMFLAFLPELILSVGSPPDTAWRTTGVAICLYSSGFVCWWFIASSRIRAAEPELFNRFAFIRMAVGHVVVILLLLAFLLSFVENGVVVCSIALLWYLLHAVQQFTRILFVRARSDLVS